MLRLLSVSILAINCLAAAAQVSLPDPLRFLATHNLFERIRADPGFDLNKPATFGYFFESKDEAATSRTREALTNDGYTFVSEHRTTAGVFVLQMAKVEVHSVNSLVDRNRLLFSLAASQGHVRYTGWDITRNAQ
jgi:hypothetical protein